MSERPSSLRWDTGALFVESTFCLSVDLSGDTWITFSFLAVVDKHYFHMSMV